jgi:alanyl-tRNA synthetase
MGANDIRKAYFDFFVSNGHVLIPSAPLVPENDPTTLFNSSGMQPLVPYLLGQPHPQGKRLVDTQKSIRLQDIEEVGDNRHTTFFEMLGNWSLGDYFKENQLPWVFEFLTKKLGLDPARLYVTVFEGNESVGKDTVSIELWKKIFATVGIDAKEGERIFAYPAKKNWWSRSGEPSKMAAGEPGGPDSEIFYDFGANLKLHEASEWKDEPCHPNCDCGRFMEIGNSVFMQYQKQADGSLKELPQKNVDFGGGLERINAAVSNTPDVFQTDSFSGVIRVLSTLSGVEYGSDPKKTRAMRIIADHLRGAVLMSADGLLPSNKAQGYVLRRLIRRAILYGRDIHLWGNWEYVEKLVNPIAVQYYDIFPSVKIHETAIRAAIVDEAKRFGKSVEKGLREIEKIEHVTGKDAFILYETYGFPWELTEEIAKSRGQDVDRAEFETEFKKHQALSRTAAAGMFKGGLADHSVETTKLHTATHLLHKALHMVLGDHVSQKGSNITVERLRFDFSHPTKITPEELQKIESIVNEQIGKNLPVTMKIMKKADALNSGAFGFFVEKYGDEVKVYTVGDENGAWFSKEICGGPHVSFTGELEHFTIVKEEAVSAGIRRIYATVTHHDPIAGIPVKNHP